MPKRLGSIVVGHLGLNRLDGFDERVANLVEASAVDDFRAGAVRDVENVDDLIEVRADLRPGYFQVELEKLAGYRVEHSEPVGGEYVENRVVVRRVVVDGDASLEQVLDRFCFGFHGPSSTELGACSCGAKRARARRSSISSSRCAGGCPGKVRVMHHETVQHRSVVERVNSCGEDLEPCRAGGHRSSGGRCQGQCLRWYRR